MFEILYLERNHLLIHLVRDSDDKSIRVVIEASSHDLDC
jgi:hypothetical protein